MNMAPEGPMAIPLWVNGHAFLTVTESFYDVVDAQTGEAVRRVPLCGAAEAGEAARAAKAAQPAWAALTAAERQAHLAALADALAGYAGHFAKLVRQETGKDEADAAAEVDAAVAALRGAAPSGQAGVVAVVTDAGRPLAALAELMAPALAAGATVVCKPSPKAPSAAFALCELSTRAGWPAGVLNLMQGDEAAIDGLCSAAEIDRLAYGGDAALGERIAPIAARHGKPFAAQGR
ncbi:MAG TPA: aldehyde dehydrogenase family protein [Rhodocyclaceae bacterium]|nr:aldehyde dehydrogenase family protein [Rhodocyclaceae bacterium]